MHGETALAFTTISPRELLTHTRSHVAHSSPSSAGPGVAVMPRLRPRVLWHLQRCPLCRHRHSRHSLSATNAPRTATTASAAPIQSAGSRTLWAGALRQLRHQDRAVAVARRPLRAPNARRTVATASPAPTRIAGSRTQRAGASQSAKADIAWLTRAPCSEARPGTRDGSPLRAAEPACCWISRRARAATEGDPLSVP